MPATFSRCGERTIAKRPEPQYVSTRCVGLAVVVALVGEDGVPNVVGQREQDGVVVLEERASVVLEHPVADFFADGTFLISHADVAVEGLR